MLVNDQAAGKRLPKSGVMEGNTSEGKEQMFK
jgi:hypothetical protein